jgi:hypothetical protein
MARINEFKLDELRARLAKMTNIELNKFGRAARYMIDAKNGPVDGIYILQLEEARLEYRRRRPKQVDQGKLSAKARSHWGP